VPGIEPGPPEAVPPSLVGRTNLLGHAEGRLAEGAVEAELSLNSRMSDELERIWKEAVVM
jgi:hypothetical protein